MLLEVLLQFIGRIEPIPQCLEQRRIAESGRSSQLGNRVRSELARELVLAQTPAPAVGDARAEIATLDDESSVVLQVNGAVAPATLVVQFSSSMTTVFLTGSVSPPTAAAALSAAFSRQE